MQTSIKGALYIVSCYYKIELQWQLQIVIEYTVIQKKKEKKKKNNESFVYYCLLMLPYTTVIKTIISFKQYRLFLWRIRDASVSYMHVVLFFFFEWSKLNCKVCNNNNWRVKYRSHQLYMLIPSHNDLSRCGRVGHSGICKDATADKLVGPWRNRQSAARVAQRRGLTGISIAKLNSCSHINWRSQIPRKSKWLPFALFYCRAHMMPSFLISCLH